MHFIGRLTLFGLAAALPLAAPAQSQNVFNVAVTPLVVGRTRDSVSLTYTVRVLPGSTDSLAAFVVDAPGTRLHVARPQPRTSWSTMNRFRKRPTAEWMLLENLTTAGSSTPPLAVSGAGVLDIVTYWAQPEAPVPLGETDTPADTVTSTDTIVDLKATMGKTIGIVMPADRSPEGLASRLKSLIGQMCALGWIDNAGVCNSLSVKATPDAQKLAAMQHELDAQRGKHVSEIAYVALTDNVTFLLASL
jgi:hypothetical protein